MPTPLSTNLTASFLASGAAPTRILVQPKVKYEQLFQDPFFGAPTASIAQMCHYHQVEATTHWQLLAQVPNRCGLLVPLKTIYAAFGKRVDVPEAPPGAAVIASFAGVGSSLLYRLENVVLKARPVQMLTNDGDFRFIAATADDLHLLRPPASLGYGAAYSPVAIRWFSLHEKDLLSDRGHFRVLLPAARRRTALDLWARPRDRRRSYRSFARRRPWAQVVPYPRRHPRGGWRGDACATKFGCPGPELPRPGRAVAYGLGAALTGAALARAWRPERTTVDIAVTAAAPWLLAPSWALLAGALIGRRRGLAALAAGLSGFHAACARPRPGPAPGSREEPRRPRAASGLCQPVVLQ